MDEDEKKVVKRVSTVYPAGYRMARNSGAAVQEFLYDRDESMEVIFSFAMNPHVVIELIKSLELYISTSVDDDE